MANQRLPVIDRIDTGELYHHVAFVWPEAVDRQLSPVVFAKQHKQSHSRLQSVRNVSVQLYRNLSVSTLRFGDAGNRNEIVAWFYVGYSRISSS